MIQAGTSVPSGEIALNGSGSASVTLVANADPTSVSRRSPTMTSAKPVGVLSLWTSVSRTRSNPVRPPTSAIGAGAPDPAAGRVEAGQAPASSTANPVRAAAQNGAEPLG